jgi:cyclomaltodextrin glucanotransferase
MYEGGTGYGTGYHGYWVQNYYQVNAHFGSWSDVEQFSAELHNRGMRYIQDITLNDSNPLDNHVFGLVYNGNGSVFVTSYEDDFDTIYGGRFYKHYQDTPLCEHAPADGNLWNDWQLHHCLLADLSGWNQDDPQVAQYLVGAGETWIDHGVDDFRLDAIKYVFPDFVSTFTNAMIDHLEALGRSDPYIVGEWSNGGVGQQKSLKFANDYDYFKTRILDFQLSFALNRFIGGAYEYPTQKMTGNELGEFLSRRVQAFHGNDDWTGTFIDNHDQIRTMTRLDAIGLTSETERRQRADLATVMLMTVRGIPIIYYGDEQYLAVYDAPGVTYEARYINSGDDDPWNRPGMQSWDETTPAFRIISILAALRASDSAIWRGSYNKVYSDNDVLVYQRQDGNNLVLVAVNRGGAKDISLHNNNLGFAPGTYRGVIADASPANTNNYVQVDRRSAVIHLEPISSIVLPN